MSEIVKHGSIGEKIEWAKSIAPSGILPKSYRSQPANLLVAAEYADALHIPRINALTSIHIIEGTPSLSADLMVKLARDAGHRVRVQFKEGAARAVLIRDDDPDFEYESLWTLDRAQKAGLTGKGNWKSYPEAMLMSRAKSEVVRMGASEVLSGSIYTPEELGVEVRETGEPAKPAPPTATEQADTVDELLANTETGEVQDYQDQELPLVDEGEVQS